jgi:murein DD-endopeptidase MepM/ murein hydrolase activator NlpD
MSVESVQQAEQRGRWASLMSQIFVEREVFVRVNGHVHFYKFGSTSQKVGALLALVLGVWLLAASGGFFVERAVIAQKNEEVEAHRMAYLDLLSEVGAYQNQFTSILRNMEDNQTLLRQLIEEDEGQATDLAELEGHLRNSEASRVRATEARDALRRKLDGFESELAEVATRNAALEAQTATLTKELEQTRGERNAIQTAHDDLVETLNATRNVLSEARGTNRVLRNRVAALSEELQNTYSIRDELLTTRLRLHEQIENLDDKLLASQKRQGALESAIAELEIALVRSQERGGAMTRQRDALTAQVSELSAQLVAVEAEQVAVMEDLSQRAMRAIDVFEHTLEMTGIDVEEHLGRVADGAEGMGGPFIPAVEMVDEFGSRHDYGVTLALLNLRLTRWEGLREAMRHLPLGAPLNDFRISSGFGVRKDPVNGRRARHGGLDFVAASGSSVLTTAPGKVSFAGWRGRYGRIVEVDHGFGIKTRYAHLRKISVKAGQDLNHRDKIGLLGSSGRSTGPHVHYEVLVDGKRYDPMNFLKAGRYVFKE